MKKLLILSIAIALFTGCSKDEYKQYGGTWQCQIIEYNNTIHTTATITDIGPNTITITYGGYGSFNYPTLFGSPVANISGNNITIKPQTTSTPFGNTIQTTTHRANYGTITDNTISFTDYEYAKVFGSSSQIFKIKVLLSR